MSFLEDEPKVKKVKNESKAEKIHSGSSCPKCHKRAKGLKIVSDKVECVACGEKYKP